MPATVPSVDDFLATLPDDRRTALDAVRATILDRLPEGVEEAMQGTMVAYQVPLTTYPDTYNGKPLMMAALASQKRHMAVYLMGIYADEATRNDFEAAYRATGKRFDVGKSCVRFRTLDDLPLDVVGDAVAAVDVPTFIARYEAARKR
ncbi:MAG: DUF1801 domain-containing protein [Bacteroidota bacterium]